MTGDEIERYRTQGYLAPLDALNADEVGRARGALRRWIDARGWPLDAAIRHKPHLLQKCLSDLVHHPTIVGAVTALIGADVMAWRTTLFIKTPRDLSYVAWHQDSLHWGLHPHDVVTAWVALTDSIESNGCVRVAARSHNAPEVAHRYATSPRNALLRGQSADVDVPAEDVRTLELRAGQFSLHHVRLLHSSPPNPSDTWRMGFAVRYIACHVNRRGRRDAATLVAGTDRHGHFEHEPIPVCDEDPAAVAAHRRSVRRYVREIAHETLASPSLASLVTVGRIALSPRSYRGVLGYLRR